jgi:hypothetical protein
VTVFLKGTTKEATSFFIGLWSQRASTGLARHSGYAVD